MYNMMIQQLHILLNARRSLSALCSDLTPPHGFKWYFPGDLPWQRYLKYKIAHKQMHTGTSLSLLHLSS